MNRIKEMYNNAVYYYQGCNKECNLALILLGMLSCFSPD